MRKILKFIVLFLIINASAQVGINTQDPKATLDVSGNLKIDEVNKAIIFNIEEDYILIRGKDNIVKRIKFSDFNSETRKPIFAVLNANGYSGNSIRKSATNSYIELPKGKWLVQASILIKCHGFKINQSQWVRTTFSDTANGEPSPDIKSGLFISGAITGPTEHAIMNGSIVIENESETPKKYYFVKYKTDFYNNFGINDLSSDRCNFDKFGSNVWSENNIFATPL